MEDEVFERHINPQKEIKIGDDVFKLQPLRYKDMGKFWSILKVLSKMKFKEVNEEEELSQEDIAFLFDSLDESTIETILELEIRMLKYSYPNKKEELLQSFAKANMFDLFNVMLEMNSPKGDNLMKKKYERKTKDRETHKSEE